MTRTLLLIDLSSYLLRSYNTAPQRRAADGQPASVVLDLLARCERLSKLHAPTAMAAVFGYSPGPGPLETNAGVVIRHPVPSLPADVAAQIKPLQDGLQAHGWPVVRSSSDNAGDVVATLASIAVHDGWFVLVASDNVNASQLVEAGVSLVGLYSDDVFDTDAIVRRTGVQPARIPELIALVGDPLAGIPGVAGVGPRAARTWLSTHDGLDGLLAGANALSGPGVTGLLEAIDWLPAARSLHTLRRDVSLDAPASGIAPWLLPRPPEPALQQWWTSFADGALGGGSGEGHASGMIGTDGMARGPEPRSDGVGPAISEPDSRDACDADLSWLEAAMPTQCDSADDFTTWLQTQPSGGETVIHLLATDEARPRSSLPIGIALCTAGAPHFRPAFVALGLGAPSPGSAVLALGRWLGDADSPKILHDAKKATHLLTNAGLQLRGIRHDTMLAAYVLASHVRPELASLASRYLPRGGGAAQAGIGGDIATRACGEVRMLAAVHQGLRRRLGLPDNHYLDILYQNVELPVASILTHMERTGVLIDRGALADQSASLALRLRALERAAHEVSGLAVKLGSPAVVADVLYNQLGLPSTRTRAGNVSTDDETLERLADLHPLPALVREYRALETIKSRGADKLAASIDAVSGRVHTHYDQAKAVTGRLTSSDPNLHGVPVRSEDGRRIREAFVAPQGHVIVAADYSQIELRILAHIAGDAALTTAFRADQDVHAATAARLFGVALGEVTETQRRFAKTINFGLINGIGVRGLSRELGVAQSDAKAFMTAYLDQFPQVKAYLDDAPTRARAKGYAETVFGRRIWIPDINAFEHRRRAGAERSAINAPMQGTGADVIKLAMIAVASWLRREGLATRLVMQVHDELVFEVPFAEKVTVMSALPELLSSVVSLDVPLRANVASGSSWAEAH